MRGVSDQIHNYASPFLFTSNNSPAFQNWVSGGMGENSPHSADVRHIADGFCFAFFFFYQVFVGVLLHGEKACKCTQFLL